MRDVVDKTWFATLMFTVSIVGVGVALGWIDPHGAWINVAIVMMVTVPTWWGLIGRQERVGPRRGALAGALCAALVFLVPILFLTLTIMFRGPGQGDGLIGIMALAGMALMAIPLGAVVGTITVLLQRRWIA
jgi:hypothetical protein